MAAPRPSGNARTGQDKEFKQADTVLRTRDEFDRNEKTAEAKNLATVAPDAAGMDVSSRFQRMGRTMTTSELMAKLHAINPQFVCKVSTSDGTKCGLYLPQYVRTPTGGFRQDLVHLLGLENTSHPLTGGVMPEFSILEAIDETVPGPDGDKKQRTFKAETRGWRTVVIRLLIKGIITVSDVQKHFGLIPSKDSARWKDLLISPIDLMTNMVDSAGGSVTASAHSGESIALHSAPIE